MEYLKTSRALFSMKILFWPIWAKRAQIDRKIKLLNFLKNLLKIQNVFLGNNLKWKLILLLIFHHQSHIASNCFFRHYHFKCVWLGMPKLPKITSLLFLCNILRKKWVMKLIFLHADKYKSLLQIHTMILIGIVKHSQSFQNSKFTISLEYLKKEVRDEVDFCM